MHAFQLNNNYQLLEQYLTDIVSGLVYLHERGLIHRDLKLSNLMLDGGRVKIIDFGISIWRWMLPLEKNSCVGSPCYMAPEVILRRYVDPNKGTTMKKWTFMRWGCVSTS